MNIDDLRKILEKEPAYRLKQVKKALFGDLIEDWSRATVLPKVLKDSLEENCPLEIEAKIFASKNGPVRALFVLADGLKIESVLLRHSGGRNTVCVSSQAGCALNCRFCATGRTGFKRNLEYWEIVNQVLFFARFLKRSGQKVTNVVFMGMGEPFLNYDNVIKAIRTLNDKDNFALGARHFSISSVGIIEGIEKLSAEDLQINLAISLHAACDELRGEMMPVNAKYPLAKIISATRKYIEKTKRRVMFEYIMIKGVNDSDEDAENLSRLLKDIPLCFVNLISYNPTGIFKPSERATIKKFKEILEKAGIPVTQRYSFGQDINAACGQLAGKDN